MFSWNSHQKNIVICGWASRVGSDREPNICIDLISVALQKTKVLFHQLTLGCYSTRVNWKPAAMTHVYCNLFILEGWRFTLDERLVEAILIWYIDKIVNWFATQSHLEGCVPRKTLTQYNSIINVGWFQQSLQGTRLRATRLILFLVRNLLLNLISYCILYSKYVFVFIIYIYILLQWTHFYIRIDSTLSLCRHIHMKGQHKGNTSKNGKLFWSSTCMQLKVNASWRF